MNISYKVENTEITKHKNEMLRIKSNKNWTENIFC